MMRREEKTAAAGLSAREILAAWVCCGLIGAGGMLLDAVSQGRPGTPNVYAGIQLPGSGHAAPADRSIADEFADLKDLLGDDAVGSALRFGIDGWAGQGAAMLAAFRGSPLALRGQRRGADAAPRRCAPVYSAAAKVI